MVHGNISSAASKVKIDPIPCNLGTSPDQSHYSSSAGRFERYLAVSQVPHTMKIKDQSAQEPKLDKQNAPFITPE